MSLKKKVSLASSYSVYPYFEIVIFAQSLRNTKNLPVAIYGLIQGVLLDRNLLTSTESWRLPYELYSCWNARGIHNPLRLTLELRPDVLANVRSVGNGIHNMGDLSVEQIEAYSTYFHETIHWWQHVGSTLGLILSLSYPAQTHINIGHLKEFLEKVGPLKSILSFNFANAKPHKRETEIEHLTNNIVNNWFDIEFARWIAIEPHSLHHLSKEIYFESIGHSYNIAWTNVINLLSGEIDDNFDVLPNPRMWQSKFDNLTRNRHEGFYYGSTIHIPPLGAKQIFEGQARFSQIQYLSSALLGVSWENLEKAGMLEGVYQEAFRFFISALNVPWPDKPDDQLVSLFLLVCDISINPTVGFPFEIVSFPLFIRDIDPGIRFYRLCSSIRERHPELIKAIYNHSKDEYLEVSELLCEDIGGMSPYKSAKLINDWCFTLPKFKKLLLEDKLFDFQPHNLPIRVFAARFLRFQQDRVDAPEFFCWPGKWVVGKNLTSKVDTLFDRHRALFVSGDDGDIYPRNFRDKTEDAVHKTFGEFHTWGTVYDLTRQWIIDDGDFDVDLRWLTSRLTKAQTIDIAYEHFEKLYGLSPRAFVSVNSKSDN